MNKFVKVAIIATSMLALGTLSAQAGHHSSNSAFIAIGSSASADAGHHASADTGTGAVVVLKGNAAAEGETGSFAVVSTSHHGTFAAAGGGTSVSACSGHAC